MIDEAEGRRIAALPKKAADVLVWTDRLNHAGVKHCASVLADPAGVSLPGLTVVLEVKAPIHVDSCLYLFTVFQLLRGRRYRAYQLEIVPARKLSHVAPGQRIHGPHEHFGEVAFPVSDPTVHCGDWPACHLWFLRRCTLEASPLTPP